MLHEQYTGFRLKTICNDRIRINIKILDFCNYNKILWDTCHALKSARDKGDNKKLT